MEFDRERLGAMVVVNAGSCVDHSVRLPGQGQSVRVKDLPYSVPLVCAVCVVRYFNLQSFVEFGSSRCHYVQDILLLERCVFEL